MKLSLVLIALTVFSTASLRATEIEHIITRRGDKLLDGEQEFRFVSFNIPNLHQVEDDFAPDKETAWGWPTEFEITDALESIRQMGGQVVRTYVLTVKREGSDMGDFVYVKGPGEFNEVAFQVLDLVLKIARDKGVRVFVPLVDQWHWMGGRAEYAAFRGRKPDDFWTDEQVIADFEETIRYVLNRKNSLTGVAYKDDPTIFGWETGNEIKPPHEWTRRIAAFIKGIDDKHLVIDGNSLQGISEEQLADPNTDVLTTHHYPQPGQSFLPPIREAWAKCRGKKPYFVGEFGFVPIAEVKEVLDFVVNKGISGSLMWSLRYHHRDGGFYWHSEPLGAGLYKAYHWPGFDSDNAYEEKQVMEVMRNAAFKIRGLEVPPLVKPAPPKLLWIDEPCAIRWQGSAGAAEYDVLRAKDKNGPWEVVGKGVNDAAYPYSPLFSDESAEPGESYYYSVVARNPSGSSEASNIMGPVKADHRVLVDHCQNLSLVDSHAGDMHFATGEDRKTREDSHRLKLAPGSSVTYKVDEPISDWTADVYFADDDARLMASTSSDGVDFRSSKIRIKSRGTTKNDYNFLRCAVVSSRQIPQGAKYLRLEFSASEKDTAAQIGRVVIRYGKIGE
jgi:hypothetical protein